MLGVSEWDLSCRNTDSVRDSLGEEGCGVSGVGCMGWDTECGFKEQGAE